MARLWARFLQALFALPFSVCQGQTAIPDPLPDLKYPPIARAAHVQGDVVVSFRQTLEGGTADVRPISGPPMLQGIAVENVRAWHFAITAEPARQVFKVTFHFQLDSSNDGYDYDSQPLTKVELDGIGGATSPYSLTLFSRPPMRTLNELPSPSISPAW